MADDEQSDVLKPREVLGDREHCEHFGVTIYEVVSPTVGEIRVHQMWGWRVGNEDRGGASFVQEGTIVPVSITTSLVVPNDEDAGEAVAHAASLRPFGLVNDRLHEIRYPEDFDKFERADWWHWADGVTKESEGWITDDGRWTAARVVVDGAVYEGVQTRIDDSFVAGAFYLPEGRLDISIEVGKAGHTPPGF